MNREVAPQTGAGGAEHTGVMGRWSLTAMTIGIMVGSGIVSLVGQAIGLTGHSAWLAYLLAIVLGFFYELPIALATSAVRLDGGPPGLVGAVLGLRFGGVYVICSILYFPGLALYAVSLTTYIQSLLPGVPFTLTCIIILTVFYLCSLMGMKAVKLSQNVMTCILLAGFAALVIWGLPRTDFSLLAPVRSDFLTGGVRGLTKAMFLLMFSTYGKYTIVFMSRHAKDPKRDIPFAMFATTGVITAIFLSVTAVASGVLPLDQVANQPLTYVARAVLPVPLFVFFMIGAPLMALATTLNGLFNAYVEPIYVATTTGWLPAWLGKCNRAGNPWILQTLMYLSTLVPVLLGWDMNTIANSILLVDMCLGIMLMSSFALLPQKYPQLWEKRVFRRLPTWLYYIFICLAFCVQALIILNSIVSIRPYIVLTAAAAFGIGGIYAVRRSKKVNIASAWCARKG